jgi:hypothetical protein
MLGETAPRTGYGMRGIGAPGGSSAPRTARWRWPQYDPLKHAIAPVWISPAVAPALAALPSIPEAAGDDQCVPIVQ